MKTDQPTDDRKPTMAAVREKIAQPELTPTGRPKRMPKVERDKTSADDLKVKREAAAASCVRGEFVVARTLLMMAGKPEEQRANFKASEKETEELKQVWVELLAAFGFEEMGKIMTAIMFSVTQAGVLASCADRAGITSSESENEK